MAKKKATVRAEFRKAVFERDHYRCACCGKTGSDRQGGTDHLKYHKMTSCVLDAHHIISRDLLPSGGYVKENGISVCDECHLKAEAYWAGTPVESGFLPDDLYAKIGSSEQLATTASKALGTKHDQNLQS